MSSEEKKEEPKKTKAELEAERKIMMARAAIKHGITIFSKAQYETAPKELKEFWAEQDTKGWNEHLLLLTTELRKYKQLGVKKLLFDLDHYVRDCKKLVPGFSRTKEEILLMVAIGQIKIDDFIGNLSNLPSNREKLDRKIHKQIRELDWQDDQALTKLDELTAQLDQPRIKKDEIEKIEADIKVVEVEIQKRKKIRDELAIKLVEWKSRGNIDIAGKDGEFRLDA